MITTTRFHAIEAALTRLGFECSEQALAIAPPPTADAMAEEAVYVICNSGMRVTIAGPVAAKCMTALRSGHSAAAVFGHLGKAAAIDFIWARRQELFDQLKVADDPLAFCASLPFIGPTTKFHLAKNLGADVAKPDIHLTRLAARERATPQQLCQRLARATERRIASVDTILWRACAYGVLHSNRYLQHGWASSFNPEPLTVS